MDLLHERLAKYDLPQQMKEKGIYPYFREIEGKQGTEVEMEGHNVLMFGSNAYTGLTGDDRVINAGIEKVIVRDDDTAFRVIEVKDWIADDESLQGSFGY